MRSIIIIFNVYQLNEWCSCQGVHKSSEFCSYQQKPLMYTTITIKKSHLYTQQLQ